VYLVGNSLGCADVYVTHQASWLFSTGISSVITEIAGKPCETFCTQAGSVCQRYYLQQMQRCSDDLHCYVNCTACVFEFSVQAATALGETHGIIGVS